MSNIELLDALVKLVAFFEGFRTRAYKDQGGVWTIGYGETLGVKEGMVWTEEYARERLRIRLANFLLGVLRRCPQLHSDLSRRVIACTSLAYNIGIRAFSISSVCRLTNRREYKRATECFLLWNKIKGIINRGLTNRRIAEMNIYSGATRGY